MGMALVPKAMIPFFGGSQVTEARPWVPAEAPPDLLPARGGVVRVRLNGDRVIIGGQAVTVMRGELAA